MFKMNHKVVISNNFINNINLIPPLKITLFTITLQKGLVTNVTMTKLEQFFAIINRKTIL